MVHNIDVSRAVIPAEQTWKVKSDAPFFEPRLIVDTCAHFVAASFLVRAAKGELQLGEDGPVGSPMGRAPTLESLVERSPRRSQEGSVTSHMQTPRLAGAVVQAMTSHAHGYAGAERLAMEMVPRCIPLRDQLKQTVRPICYNPSLKGDLANTETGTSLADAEYADGVKSIGDEDNGEKDLSLEEVHELHIDYEIERFLRSRLVVCDLGQLLAYDCFSDMGEKLMSRGSSTLTQMPRAGRRYSQATRQSAVGMRRRKAIEVEQWDDAFDEYIVEERKEGMDAAVRRFELRFWRTFIAGLGRALFGEREDLVTEFEKSADDLFARFERELQLAMNSLLGWLPNRISESLFVAFVGLQASVGVRQQNEKYAMLHQCVSTLTHGSGRYLFVSTPSWYLPLVSWLPLVGSKVQHRMKNKDISLGFRPVWMATCMDAIQCMQAVDRIWGGRIPGKRAPLQFLRGFEPFALWVLRMTLGCERLFSLALDAISNSWKQLEAAYDENESALLEFLAKDVLQVGSLRKGLLKAEIASAHPDVMRGFACAAADQIVNLTQAYQRQASIQKRGSIVAVRRQSRASIASKIGKQASLAGVSPSDLARLLRDQEQPRESFACFGEEGLDSGPFSPVRSQTISARRLSSILKSSVRCSIGATDSLCSSGLDDDFELDVALTQGPSFLARLHADAHNLGTLEAPGSSCRLRRTIVTGAHSSGTIPALEWPVARSGGFIGKIPIHDTPDLLPMAPPPPIEASDVTSMGPLRRASALSDRTHLGDSDVEPSSGSSSDLTDPRAEQDEEEMAEGEADTGPRRPRRRSSQFYRSAPQVKGGYKYSTALERMAAAMQNGGQEGAATPLPEEPAVDASAQTFEEIPDFDVGPQRQRRNSAPPAVDSRDFDTGDPLKNTVVALALQDRVRAALLNVCETDGPLHFAWRRPLASEALQDVQQGRLMLGVLLLFSAWRAPLPTWAELPLHYFSTVGGRTVQLNSGALSAPKVPLPDGVFAVGCMPLFHSCQSSESQSGKVAPLVSGAFRVGVPHAFLDGRTIRNALTYREHNENQTSTALRWREGSLLVLLASAASLEAHSVGVDWCSRSGWMHQDHCSFFRLLCAFRFLLGLEFVQLWHRRLPTAMDVTLEHLFPFLQTCDAECKDLSVVLDMVCSKDNGAPLLVAPLVTPDLSGTPSFAVDGDHKWKPCQQHPGPDCELVPLQDFAAWVGHLPSGRVVYSSRHSPDTGDLYLRLTDAVVVFHFYAGQTFLAPDKVMDLYQRAVGDPKWWGVSLVSYVLFALRLHVKVSATDGGCLVFSEGKPLGNREVPEGSEVVVCSLQAFERFLGSTKTSVNNHRKIFEGDMQQQLARERQLKSRPKTVNARLGLGGYEPCVERIQHKWSALPDRFAGGSRRKATRERSPPQRPQSSALRRGHLEMNHELLKRLMEHVHSRISDLHGCFDYIAKQPAGWLDDKEAQMVASGWATRQKQESGRRYSVPQNTQKVKSPVTQAEKKRFGVVLSFKGKTQDAIEAKAKDFDDLRVRIDRVPSPERTYKRRCWRPWTPHPEKQRLKDRREERQAEVGPKKWIDENKVGGEGPTQDEPAAEMREPALPFDFLGCGGFLNKLENSKGKLRTAAVPKQPAAKKIHPVRHRTLKAAVQQNAQHTPRLQNSQSASPSQASSTKLPPVVDRSDGPSKESNQTLDAPATARQSRKLTPSALPGANTRAVLTSR